MAMRCDCCYDTFCGECASYDAHECPGVYKKNRTVPVCPLCLEAVPVKPGEDANTTMEQHIAGGCAKPSKEALFTHACSYGKCKKKELVQCICKACGMNHCIKHRHPDAHRCGQTRPPPRAAKATGQHSLATRNVRRQTAGAGAAAAAAAAADLRAQAASAAATMQRNTVKSAYAPPRIATDKVNSEDDEELRQALALSMRTGTDAAEPLIAMGYPAAAAAEAMAASGGDLQQAALLLMENASATDAAVAKSGGVRATA